MYWVYTVTWMHVFMQLCVLHQSFTFLLEQIKSSWTCHCNLCSLAYSFFGVHSFVLYLKSCLCLTQTKKYKYLLTIRTSEQPSVWTLLQHGCHSELGGQSWLSAGPAGCCRGRTPVCRVRHWAQGHDAVPPQTGPVKSVSSFFVWPMVEITFLKSSAGNERESWQLCKSK